MLRRQHQLRTQIQMLQDAGLFGVAFWLAHTLRSHLPIQVFGGTVSIGPFGDYIWLFLFILPLAPFVLWTQGCYARGAAAPRAEMVWLLFKSCGLVVMGLVIAMFLTKDQPSRSVPLLFGGMSYALLLARDELLRRWGATALGQEQGRQRLILVGTAEETARLRAELLEKSTGRVEVIAQLDLGMTPAERLAELLHEHSANGVIISARHTQFELIERVIQLCELEGVEAWLLADFFRTRISQTTVDDFHGRPTLVFRSVPELNWQAVVKQAVDVVGALLLLALFALPMLVVAVLIQLTSPGPAFFRQQRCGLNGRPFTMLKFRSMFSDAEQRQQELAAFNEMSGPVFKVTNDPRVTRVGGFLRRTSIDEWPQLWNVLRGEMSLVGPRPLPVGEVQRFDDPAHRRRLSVKPGLTCLWQIRGRSNVSSFAEWVRLDLEYIDNWSLWLDLKILLKTIPVVLLGTGAK